jgi:hypothetical protein
MSDKAFTKIVVGMISNARDLIDWGIAEGHTTEDEMRLTVSARHMAFREAERAAEGERRRTKYRERGSISFEDQM